MGNYRQTMSPVPRVYVLPRCSVALYETGNGDITVDNPLGNMVWVAQQVDNLRIGEHYDEVEQFATGSPYPDIHHTREHHEIIFDAVWNVGAKLKRNTEYQLVMTFQDASLGNQTGHFLKRFYYGVTTPSRNIDSRDANEFGSGNTLRAKFYEETEDDGAPSGGDGGGGYGGSGSVSTVDGVTYIDLGGNGSGFPTFPPRFP